MAHFFKESIFVLLSALLLMCSTTIKTGQNQLHSYRNSSVFPMAAQLFSTGSGGQIQNPVPVYQGGTGDSDLSPAFGVIVGHGINPVTASIAGTTGTLLIGNTGADPEFSATPAVTMITYANAPVASTDGTNKAYVDSFISGVHLQASCKYATTAVLSNTPTYNNGASGVGATLTAAVNGVLTVDGNTTWTVGDRVLVKDQASMLQNGIYTVTQAGSGGSVYILTRATDFDSPTEITPGDLVPVESGAVNANTFWIETATVTMVGTDPIVFSSFLKQGIVTLAGNSGSATGTTVQIAGGNNITTSASGSTLTISLTGTTDHAVQIGNASGSLTSLAVGGNGQILLGAVGANPAFVTPTAGSELTLTSNSSTLQYALSTIPEPVANGGTGSTSLLQYAVLIGNGTSPIATVAASATSEQPLLSTGSSSNPAYGTMLVVGGGTSVTSFANTYGVICAGTTTTGALQVTASPSTAGQGLVSAGATSVPTWQNVFPGYVVAANSFAYGGTTSTLGNSPVSTLILSPSAPSGILSSAINNTGLGYQVLNGLTSGTGNTALGSTAAFSLSTANNCVAVGFEALYSNVSGDSNVAVGYRAAYKTTAAENTAFGAEALRENVSGVGNTAFGYQALLNNTASGNTAFGYQAALGNTSGTSITAVGASALAANSVGTNNVAYGVSAATLVTGSQNTMIGASAGSSATTGSNNIVIGYNAQLPAAGDSDTIVIGNSSHLVTRIRGIRGITTGLGDAVAVLIDGSSQLGTISSSARFKKNIVSVDAQTAEKLSQLNIVTFSYINDQTNTIQYGAIAEEVEKIFPELIVYDKDGQILTIQYQHFVSLLIKYLQSKHSTVHELEQELQCLQATIIALQKKVESWENGSIEGNM